MALLKSTGSLARIVPAIQRLFSKPANPAMHSLSPNITIPNEALLPASEPHHEAGLPSFGLPANDAKPHELEVAPEAPEEAPIEASWAVAIRTEKHRLRAPAPLAASIMASSQNSRDPVPDRRPATTAPNFELVEPKPYMVGHVTVEPNIQHIMLWRLAKAAPEPLNRMTLFESVMQTANRGLSVVNVARSALLASGLIVLYGDRYAITAEGIAKLAELQGSSVREKAARTGQLSPAAYRQEVERKIRLSSIINLTVPRFNAPPWITNALHGLVNRLTGEALTMQPLDFAHTLQPAVQDVFDLGYAIGSGQVALLEPGQTKLSIRDIQTSATPKNDEPAPQPKKAGTTPESLAKDKQLFLELLEGSSIAAIAKRYKLRAYSVDRKIEAMRALFRAGLLDLPDHAIQAAKADAIRSLAIPDAPENLSSRHRRPFQVYVEHLQGKSHADIATAHGLSDKSVGCFVSNIRALIRAGTLTLPSNLVRLAEDDIAKADVKAQKAFFRAAPTGNNTAYDAYIRHLKGVSHADISSAMQLKDRTLTVYISRMRSAYRLGQLEVPEELAPFAVADAATHKLGFTR